MIHFTNGSNVADALREGGVTGRVVACADPLHDGPCLPGLSRVEWRDLRARHLAASHGLAVADVTADFEARDAAIDEAATADEIVLWFEHDLFDQLNLLWLVDALASARASPGQIHLVVIGEHPDIERFDGLGQLSPEQLMALLPARRTLTSDGLDEARAAWADVCAPDPRALARRAAEPSRTWPWLPGALERLVEELPSMSDGLSRTERQGLAGIGAGATTLGEAFVGCASREQRVFLGDWSFYAIMRRLHAAATPLVSAPAGFDGPPDTQHSRQVGITAFGQRVLSGDEDHAAVNGLDRWVGGTRLRGTSPRWRVAGARLADAG